MPVRDSLQNQANHDKLTGLFNRHYMTGILDRDFFCSLRYQTDLSCLLLDLDFFNDINDTFGHPFGDMILHLYRGKELFKNNCGILPVFIRYFISGRRLRCESNFKLVMLPSNTN